MIVVNVDQIWRQYLFPISCYDVPKLVNWMCVEDPFLQIQSQLSPYHTTTRWGRWSNLWWWQWTTKKSQVQAAVLQHFWSGWSKEYLTALWEYHCTKGNNVQTSNVGDVVQIHDDWPRIQWRLEVIEQLNKGADGLVRSVQLRTSTGRTNCPIAKLYPF